MNQAEPIRQRDHQNLPHPNKQKTKYSIKNYHLLSRDQKTNHGDTLKPAALTKSNFSDLLQTQKHLKLLVKIKEKKKNLAVGTAEQAKQSHLVTVWLAFLETIFAFESEKSAKIRKFLLPKARKVLMKTVTERCPT